MTGLLHRLFARAATGGLGGDDPDDEFGDYYRQRIRELKASLRLADDLHYAMAERAGRLGNALREIGENETRGWNGMDDMRAFARLALKDEDDK